MATISQFASGKFKVISNLPIKKGSDGNYNQSLSEIPRRNTYRGLLQKIGEIGKIGFCCKKSHNNALCDNRPQKFKQAGHTPMPEREVKLGHETAIINKITEKEREFLLLCKEVIAFDTENSEYYEEVLVLFHIG